MGNVPGGAMEKEAFPLLPYAMYVNLTPLPTVVRCAFVPAYLPNSRSSPLFIV